MAFLYILMALIFYRHFILEDWKEPIAGIVAFAWIIAVACVLIKLTIDVAIWLFSVILTAIRKSLGNGRA